MIIRSAPQHLIEGVRTYFAARSITTSIGVGVRAITRQDNQGSGRANRIVLIPFDPKTGAGGTITPPIHVGPRDMMNVDDPEDRVATVRAIADARRRMTLAVWARENDDPNDEAAHVYAAETLMELAMRAIASVGLADIEWGDMNWIPPPERHFGVEVQIGFSFTHPIFDEPDEVAYPDLSVTKAS